MSKGNEINTGKRTIGEFAIDYMTNGYGGCTPIIDGEPVPMLTFGYVSESDKKKCMELIEEALKATGDVMMVPSYVRNAMMVAAAEIRPEKTMTVDGVEYLISYEDRKAYDGATEVANLDDLNCELPNEAIEALLESRIRLARETENEDTYDDYEDEDDDYLLW